jgi:hypothetical protein
MFSELDAINNGYFEVPTACCDTDLQATNTAWVVPIPGQNRTSIDTTNSSSGISYVRQNPYDTTTLSSSVIGDLVDDINNDGFCQTDYFSKQKKNTSSV